MMRRLPILVLVILSLPLLCLAQQGRAPQTPAEIREAEAIRAKYPGQPIEVRVIEQSSSAQATGIGGRSRGDKASLDLEKMGAPTLSGNGFSTSGGGLEGFNGWAHAYQRDAKRWGLMILGALVALGGAIALAYGRVRLGVAGLGLGAGLIGASFLGEWAWALLALVAIGVAGFLWYTEEKNRAAQASLEKVAKGMHDAETNPEDPAARGAAEKLRGYMAAHGSIKDGAALVDAFAKVVKQKAKV